MTKHWHIRKAQPADSESLQLCMESAYSIYVERMDGNRLPPMDVNYESEIKEYPVWVAEFEGCIGGGLIMMFGDDYASIANIAVNTHFQGQGLGKQLMAFAETIAREKGYTELRLATHVLLHENLSLYSHLGWVEMDRDDIRVYMKKTI